MSVDSVDLKMAAYRAINPRHKVPAIVDNGFALFESADIVDYLEDKKPEPRLFSADRRERAMQRRLIREADAYFAPAMEHLHDAVMETKKPADPGPMRTEIARWLVQRLGQRNPQARPTDLFPPRFAAWRARMAAMDIVQKTRPPHWK